MAVATAFLCGAAVGCSEPAPDVPASPLVHLADLLEEAEYLPPAAPVETLAAAPLFVGAEATDGWHPLVRLRRAPSAAEVEAFEDGSRIEPDGSVVIGPSLGFWVRTLPVRGGSTLALRGTIEVQSLSGTVEDAFAQIGLGEIAGPIDGVPVDEVPVSELAKSVEFFHTTPEFGAPTRVRPFALLVTLAPDTTHVGLTLSHRIEGDGPAGGARFSNLHLAAPTAYDYAAAAAGDARLALQDTGGARGGFTVGRMLRDAVALPAGSGLRWRVPLAPDAKYFDAWAGLTHHEDFEPGQDFDVRAHWSIAGRAGAPLVTFETALTTAALEEGRWKRVGGELPAELRGRVATLEMRVTPRIPAAAHSTSALPVLGTPRILPERPERAGPNIVLVSLDTLRADHVGAYGYERPTTPHLDALAAESLVFEDVWAQGPYTLPSHMSLLSGQHPSVHGVQRDADARDPIRTPLLAETLRDAGWTTAAFTGGGYVHPVFGFGGGFEQFSSLELVWNRESSRIRQVLRDLPDVSVELAESRSLDDVTDWIATHRDESFFLFFHTYAAHEFDPPAEHLRALGADETGLSDDLVSLQHLHLAPGDPARPIPPVDVARLVDLYDGGVRQADESVGVLIDALRANELWDETIFIVVSDHGQEIGEHGEVGHGHTLYEEMLKVPLLLRLPGTTPERIATPAMLVDVVPTLLALLGLESHEVQGHDLRSLPSQRALYSEVDNAALKRALRNGSLKTIHGPLQEGLYFPNEREEESYDLALDPLERTPLPADPARLDPLLTHLAALRQLSAALASGQARSARVDPALRAQLTALGYNTAEDAAPASQGDPSAGESEP